MMNLPLNFLLPLLQATLFLFTSLLLFRLWKDARVAFSAGLGLCLYLLLMSFSWVPFSYTNSLPLLLIFLGYFIRSPFLLWLTRCCALALWLIHLFLPNLNDLIPTGISIILTGYLLIRLLREPLYQDDLAFGKSLILAGTLFHQLVILMLLVMPSADDLLYSEDVRRISTITLLVWQGMILTGLYKIRKGKQEKIRLEQRVWKEEPESFRFL